MSRERINILGVDIDAIDLERACSLIEGWIQDSHRSYVCVAPVSTIIDCQKDNQYRDIINNADMVTPDGMPLVWIGKLRGNKIIERTYGPDLMVKFCQLSQQRGYRHFFLGGTPETSSRLQENLKRQFPELNIAGSVSPPFRAIDTSEDQTVLEQINEAKPDVLWVGLGSPKQDYWMRKHREKLDVPVMIGIGAAFDFHAGVKKQAPRWMQRMGLEWFFRLCCEPKRLWKRYLVGNSEFIYYLFKDLLSNQSKKKLSSEQ